MHLPLFLSPLSPPLRTLLRRLYSVFSASCSVCDCKCREVDCQWVAAIDLPNKDLLRADDDLLNCEAVKGEMLDYPGDVTNPPLLDGLVLARDGIETEAPHRLKVCTDCFNDLRKGRMPRAALANGLRLGDLPENLRNATFVEMAAARPVRINGMVLALDELKIGRVPGSAKSVMRETFTFYFQDAYGVQLQLPACDTDVAGSFTCALVGARPTDAQLRRLLGARRSMVEALLAFQQDRNNELVGKHSLARQAQVSPDNLATYEEDGSIPQAILEGLVPLSDPTNSVANARSTHARGNREPEGGVSDGEPGLNMNRGAVANGNRAPEGCVSDDAGNGGAGSNGAPYIIETNAVMPTGSDLSVSSLCRPGRLRDLGANLQESTSGAPTAEDAAATLAQRAAAEATSDTPGEAEDAAATLAQVAAAEAAAAAGRPPPAGTKNYLVITHTGRLVSDFTQVGTWVAAYFDLFPHGVGDLLAKRKRRLSLNEWARILLRRRDPRFRKDRTFLFCVCALIFRREAINNARWKLTGRVSRGVADTLASVTSEDLAAAANEMEGGKGTWTALSHRLGVRTLIKTMVSVHSGQSWTIYNKKSTRMVAISYMIQMGQPLFWLTISPADIHSPIVMTMAGVRLDVTSRLKADFPDYVEKLRLVARDPVASALFYHAMIDAVLSCLLRFGASDGDGGILGRVKGYVGMTEEQRRLSLHCHLLVWVFGYNDFASFRSLMDKTPERYGELAEFLDRVIFNQVATLGDVHLAMSGVRDGVSGLSDT